MQSSKDSLYYKWAMWMMNGPRKVQPKSGNFVAASFTEVLSWCVYAWKEVKKETILSGVQKCYMSADPGPEFEVEAVPEKMEIEPRKEKNKKRKKVVAVKSKSPAEMSRLAKKKERAKKKSAKEKAKSEKKAKRKATPKRKNRRKSPIRRVRRKRTLKKQGRRKRKN